MRHVPESVMNMDLENWIVKYEGKTGEKFERDIRFELFFHPDKGFCEIGQGDNLLIINQLCGDARFWRDLVDNAAKASGIKHCGTWCIRKEILAYIRLFGYRIVREHILPDGLKIYYAIRKETGKPGRAAPCFKYKDTGTQAYFITWEP